MLDGRCMHKKGEVSCSNSLGITMFETDNNVSIQPISKHNSVISTRYRQSFVTKWLKTTRKYYCFIMIICDFHEELATYWYKHTHALDLNNQRFLKPNLKDVNWYIGTFLSEMFTMFTGQKYVRVVFPPKLRQHVNMVNMCLPILSKDG